MRRGSALVALTLAGAAPVYAQIIDKSTADGARQAPRFACQFTAPPELPRHFTRLVITNSGTLPIPSGKVIRYAATNNRAQSGTITLTQSLEPGKSVVEALKFKPNVGVCTAILS